MHEREIRSDRGAVFVMCTRALTDPAYEKYPRLPVLRCNGFERRPSVEDPPPGMMPRE
jgi:hypothetical protein